MSTVDFICTVPAEVACLIFSKLEARDLLICCLVSKYWQWIANTDECWRPHVADLVEGSLPIKANFKAFYLQINSRSIRDISEMVLHMKAFLETISVEHPDARFRCFIPFEGTISTDDEPISISFRNKLIQEKKSEDEIVPFSLRTRFVSINAFNIQTDYFYVEERDLLFLVKEVTDALKLAPEKVARTSLHQSPFSLSTDLGSFRHGVIFYPLLSRFIEPKTKQLSDQYQQSKSGAENRLTILGVIGVAFVIFGEFFS